MANDNQPSAMEALSLRVFSGAGVAASAAELEDFAQRATDIWLHTSPVERAALRAELARLACSLLGPQACDNSCFTFVDQRVISPSRPD